MVGCSSVDNDANKLGYEPVVRDKREVEDEVGSLSSRVLEMLRVKGQVTEPGPMTNFCETGGDDTPRYRVVAHPWSLYGVDNNALGKGMDRLADQLPKKGWKVVRQGPDSSKNRNLEIVAVHVTTHTHLEVTWMKGQDGHEPLISVDVTSRCFRDDHTPND